MGKENTCVMCDEIESNNFHTYGNLKFCCGDHTVNYLFKELNKIKKKLRGEEK